MQKVTRYILAIICIGISIRVMAEPRIPDDHPPPQPMAPIKLALHEAIYLAVRDNPNVQASKLSHVMQKFNVWVQEWQFMPHYSLQATGGYNRSVIPGSAAVTNNYTVAPGVSLLTPVGTSLSLTGNVARNQGRFTPGLTLQIEQPLIRGFGKAIVEATLQNAQDSQTISCLSVQGLLRTTVSGVINAYLDVVSAEKTVEINDAALKRAQRSVEQTRLYIKAGHKAGNEIVTVAADAASSRSQLENSKNNLLQARFALLAAIGVAPNTKVEFSTLDLNQLMAKYHLPTLEDTKRMALENDIQYQTDKITLNGATKRALMIAEDNTRWQLNLSVSATKGAGAGGGIDAGFNTLFNGDNHSESAQLQLTVPIDDQVAKQAVLGAKIALKQADLALMQERFSKETGAINGWNLVVSAGRALHFAENAERLQEKTYDVSYQKYLHGLIDSLALQQAQLQLIQAQQALLSAKISYVKSLVNLDLLIGHTLTTWQVDVRL